MKKRIKHPVLLAFFSIFTAFVLWAIFLLGWLMSGGIGDYRQFLLDHEQQMTSHADAFLAQNTLQQVWRFRTFKGIYYSIQAKNNADSKEAAFSFTAPYNEHPFWKTAGLAQIHGESGSSTMALATFLEANGIAPEEFLKWKGFLAEYGLESISLGKDSYSVDIHDTTFSCYLYHTSPYYNHGFGLSYMDIITPHWAYYDEHGVMRTNGK